MSNPQPSPELTTRDVLQQIDHRLGLIETDVRENNTKIEAKIDALDAKTEAKFNALDAKIDAFDSKFEDSLNALDHKVESKIDTLDHKVESKIDGFAVEIREIRREFNGKFNLVIGLVITTWLSMMGTLFFKL